MVSNSLCVTSGFMTKRETWRRAARSPRLANVIIRSGRRRDAFALASVGSMRSYWNRAVIGLRSTARRCEAVLLSLRWSLRGRMPALHADRALVLVEPTDIHAEG